jgi:ABC-type amino acid transport substrate-binding protein
MYENGRFSGFSIDLWREIARLNGWRFELEAAPNLASLLEGVERKRADLAIAAITITAQREKRMDFSHPFFRSGLAIMTRNDESGGGDMGRALKNMLFSSGFLWAAGLLLFSLFLVANAIWLVERGRNEDFSRSYPQGLWDALWWAMVTLTTVGYGDKAPRAPWGKIIAMLWMIAGYFMFAYFTAAVTSSATVRRLQAGINGPDDLAGRKVAVIRKSTSAAFLQSGKARARLVPVDQVDSAISLLEARRVDAIVHDAPVLFYHAASRGRGWTRIAGPVFHKEDYGLAFPDASPLREKVNRALLAISESGEYERLYEKWFGRKND